MIKDGNLPMINMTVQEIWKENTDKFVNKENDRERRMDGGQLVSRISKEEWRYGNVKEKGQWTF